MTGLLRGLLLKIDKKRERERLKTMLHRTKQSQIKQDAYDKRVLPKRLPATDFAISPITNSLAMNTSLRYY